jgi:hypothetical protein
MTAWKREKIQKQHPSALPVEKASVAITAKNLSSPCPLDSHLTYKDFQRDCQGFFVNTVLTRQLKTDSTDWDDIIPDFFKLN